MKYNILYLLFTIICFSNKVYAEALGKNEKEDKKLSIEVLAPDIKGKIYFAKYYEGKPYAIDSTETQINGSYFFNVPTVDEGEYLLYVNPSLVIPLILNEDNQTLKIMLDKDGSNTEIIGSKETEILWDFNREIVNLWKVQNLEETKENSKVWERAEEIVDKYSSANPDSFINTYILSKKPVMVPFPFASTNEEKTANINYLKSNFWNNIDLTSSSLWNGPTIYNLLDEYLKDIVYPEPDSIAVAVSELAGKMQSNKFVFREFLSYMINKTNASNNIGQENIWAKLLEDYIINDNDWIDPIQYRNLLSEYSVIKNNRIGMTALNINAEDIENNIINTNDINADYTILYFYSPGCGFCETETPEVKRIYEQFKDKNIKVIGFNVTAENKENWLTFITEKGIEDWINLGDPNNKSQYWLNYDVRGTPSIYILDKDKKIIAKKIDSSNLEYILNLYLK